SEIIVNRAEQDTNFICYGIIKASVIFLFARATGNKGKKHEYQNSFKHKFGYFIVKIEEKPVISKS
ncbi:MAG: hypothetical protein RSA98_02355, partial [Odoribacter sp.]